MKVVLKVDVDKLGKTGDVVEAAAGYVRNYLIPQGKAIEANKRNLKLFEDYKRTELKKQEKERQQAEELAGKIEHVPARLSCRRMKSSFTAR